jgi:hypothetical protein
MKNYKNYLIALLTGLLVLSISTQPSQGAGTSAAAKAIQYDWCIKYAFEKKGYESIGYEYQPVRNVAWLDGILKDCAKYRP